MDAAPQLHDLHAVSAPHQHRTGTFTSHLEQRASVTRQCLSHDAAAAARAQGMMVQASRDRLTPPVQNINTFFPDRSLLKRRVGLLKAVRTRCCCCCHLLCCTQRGKSLNWRVLGSSVGQPGTWNVPSRCKGA